MSQRSRHSFDNHSDVDNSRPHSEMTQNRHRPVRHHSREGDGSKVPRHNIHSLSWQWPMLVLLLGCLLYYSLHLLDHTLPTVQTAEDLLKTPHLFSGERSRNSLRILTRLGPRVVGDVANEISAPDLIMKELTQASEAANPSQSLLFQVQKGSGAYQLEFVPSFTNIYKNIQNVLAKLEGSDPSHSILLNCHYDTVPTSDGASDDAITCAVMLELIRVLSIAEVRLSHSIIFLFNGAEETPLQGSHLFLTHEWAKSVRLVLNLESAGLGGRALLFQSGPQNAWLLNYYADSVPHPHGQIVGEELFQNGAIPSDTDFRIFRDFGNIPGLDFAFCRNGYVYHTKYDSEEYIPAGSHQHLGNNILALLRKLGHAHELRDMKANSGGQMVYYDFLGWFLIRYSVSTGVALNIITILLSIFSIAIFMGRLSQWKWLPKSSSYVKGKLAQNKFIGKIPKYFSRFKPSKKQVANISDIDSAFVNMTDEKYNGITNLHGEPLDESTPAPVEVTISSETTPKQEAQLEFADPDGPRVVKNSTAWIELGYAFGARMAGILAVIVTTAIMAAFIDGVAPLAMPWYANVWLIFPLYWCPGLAAYGVVPMLVNTWRRKKYGLSLSTSTQLSVIASQIPFIFGLLIMTSSGARSASILLLPVLSSALANFIIYLTPLYLSVHKWVWVHLFIHIPHLVFSSYLALLGYMFFLPIMGRSGLINGDLYMAVVSAIFIIFITTFAIPLMSLVRRPGLVLGLLVAFSVVMVPVSLTTFVGHPYRTGPNNPAPQRYWIMHSDRQFFNESNMMRRQETGYFVLNLDRNSPRTIPLRGRTLYSLKQDCEDELYCGLPLYMTRMVPLSPKSSWIPAPPPFLPKETDLTLIRKSCSQVLSQCTLQFVAKGPDRMTLTFAPRSGATLDNWSVPSTPESSEEWNGRPTYYLHIVTGSGSTDYEISITFNVTADIMLDNKPILDIGLAGNHIHDEWARTDEFSEFLNTFPDWTQMTGWISSYKAYVF